MREGLNHLCFPTYYRGPFVASKYCESTPRSQVNLSHDSSRARRAVGAMSCWGLLAGLLAMDIRTMGRVERWIEPAVLSHILQRPIHSYVALSPPAEEADILATLSPFLYPSLLSSHATGRDPLRHTFDPLIEGSSKLRPSALFSHYLRMLAHFWQ